MADTPTIPPAADDEAMRIAGTLGKRQREVILRCSCTPRRAIDFYGDTAAALRWQRESRGPLTDRNIERDHGRRTAWYFLTPLGLRVKDALQNEGTGDER